MSVTCKGLVSIVCPLYNKERYIARTIQSVLGQTSPQWELLLVDDGSTDNSFDIATKAAEKDSKIRLIRREEYKPQKKGANTCRNIGIDQAKGEFVVFLDADDVMLANCVEQRLAVAKLNSPYDMYIFNVAYAMDHDMEPYSKGYGPSNQLTNAIAKGDERRFFLRKFLSFDLPWHTSGPLWRKDCLVMVGGFDENFERLQDPEIHTRTLLNKNLRICSQISAMPHDVIHLKDEKRMVWNSSQFYEKQIESVEIFVNKFASLVQSSEGESYVKYLQGYLLFAETLSYRYLRDNPANVTIIKDKLVRLYKSQVIAQISRPFYGLFIKVYRTILTRNLIRFKIPGVLLFFYKRFVFWLYCLGHSLFNR